MRLNYIAVHPVRPMKQTRNFSEWIKFAFPFMVVIDKQRYPLMYDVIGHKACKIGRVLYCNF